MTNRASDDYHKMDPLKEKDFNKLLDQYLKFEINEDEI